MDNLELLQKIPDNYINLIYCDILYNTGRKFKDFKDNLGTPQEAILWYKPRLEEMCRVLKETGCIYLHMDWRLVHYIKVVMDEIFGIKNYRNEIIWCYKSGGINKKDFPKKYDNILKYSKTDSYPYYPELVPYSEKTIKRGLTKCKDIKYKLKNEGTPVINWWDDITPLLSPTCYERVGYDTQKPKKLLERIIKTSSNKGDIVADFFCGSGTTLVVAKELERKYIGCDINSRAVEITNQRLQKIL